MKLTRQTAAKFGRCLFHRHGSSPLEVQIELTNRCNFDCAMCPRGKLKTPVKDMDEATFGRVFAAIAGVPEIILTGWGEPLIHPQFFDFVRKIKNHSPKTRVRFTTNGCLLDDENVARIIETGIDSVAVSLDSLADQPGPGHPKTSQVTRNIRRLCSARMPGKAPEVVLQTTLNDGGEPDLLDVVTFGAEVGVDRVNLVRLITTYDPDLKRPNKQAETATIRKAKELGKEKGVEVLSINDPDKIMALMTHGDKLCIKSAYHAYITVDGEVTPCCNMRNHVMGNVLDAPIAELWMGEAFTDFFKNQREICANCDQMKSAQTSQRKPE